MSGTRGAQDPYRELGVPRGATEDQIKTAHRALAKRYHPDAPTGDRVRFLAVQEAYLVLTDPLRRRAWDAQHAPGPVRAAERPVAPPPMPRPPSAPGAPPVPRPGPAAPRPAAGAYRAQPPAAAPNDRDPATRSTTWSAQGVPWWEDFRADGVTRGSGAPTGAGGPTRPASGAGSATPGGPPGTPAGGPSGSWQPSGQQVSGPPSQGPGVGDIYAKSSGAAWSSAARRHFRKDDADLPRGGSFRYRGTQVVTGAEARQDAATEARRAASPPNQAWPPSTPSPAPRPSQPAPDASAGLRSRLRKLLGGQ